jgi:hypothetical protein
VISAVAAVAAAYVLFSDSVSEATEIQKTFADVHLEATKQIAKEKTELELLTKIAQDETIAKEKRLIAIQKLNDIIPDYIGQLSLENIKTAEGIGILKQYTAELYANARAKAVQSKFDELAKEKLEIERKTSKDYEGSVNGFLNNITGGPEFKDKKDIEKYVLKTFSKDLNARKEKNTGVTIVDKESFQMLVNGYMEQYGIADKEKELALKDAQMKSLEAELLKSTVKDLGKPNSDDASGSKFNPAGATKKAGDGKGGKKDPNSSQEDIAKRKIDEAQKTADELLALDQQLQDDKLSIMKDGAAKELLLEQERYLREIKALEAKKVHTSELAKLDADLAKAKLDGDKKEEARLFALKQGWDEKNKAYDDKIDAIVLGKLDIHNKKIATLKEKAETERIEKQQEQFELEKIERETAFNNDINAHNLSDAEKKKRQDTFNKNELEIAKEHLVKKIELLKASLAEGLFSPEVQAKMEKQLAFLENAASKIEVATDPDKKSKTETIGDAAKSAFGETDILGFTPKQWTDAFDNLDTLEGKLAAANMVVQGMQNLWSVFTNYQNASDDAQLKKFEKNSDTKKNKLKKQLDSGVISQKKYDKEVSKIDEELESKKADLDYKKAKREKAMALVGAIISTAKGVASALPNLVLAGIAAAIGGFQIATIAKQPLPAKGHEEGLYQDYVTREQDGKRFKSTYGGKTRSGLVSKTSHFLVAENGPEMVIDNKAWRQMNPAVKDSLIRELRGIKGFEQGLYNQEAQRYEVPAASSTPPPSVGDAQMMQMMMSLVAENTAVLKDLRDKGIVSIVSNKDLQSMGYLKDGIDDYNTLRNKNKR